MYDKNEIVELLSTKLAQANCPLCGDSRFEVGDGYMTFMITQELGGLPGAGRAMPIVTISCVNCGDTRFFNYIRLKSSGIIVARR